MSRIHFDLISGHPRSSAPSVTASYITHKINIIIFFSTLIILEIPLLPRAEAALKEKKPRPCRHVHPNLTGGQISAGSDILSRRSGASDQCGAIPDFGQLLGRKSASGMMQSVPIAMKRKTST